MIQYNSNPPKTLLTICVGFLVIFWATNAQWALILATVVGATGVFSNYVSKKIETFWFKLAGLLGLVMPNILLGLVYFLILVPLALLSQLRKKDPLWLKNSKQSLFVNVNKKYDKSSFKKPW